MIPGIKLIALLQSAKDSSISPSLYLLFIKEVNKKREMRGSGNNKG